MSLLKDPRTGLWVRPEMKDAEDAGEAFASYGRLGVEGGDAVLDVGAHIGAAVRRFLEVDGADRVIAVEADPGNAEVLRYNVDGDPRVRIVQAAVTARGSRGRRAARVTFWPHPTRPSCSGLYERKRSGAKPITVPATTLSKLLRLYSPRRVKVDIEGAEYPAMLGLRLPPSVRSVLIELHRHRRGWPEMARELARELREQGFEADRPLNLGKSDGWPRLGAWHR